MKPQPSATRLPLVRPRTMPLTRALVGSGCAAFLVAANLLWMGATGAAIATTSIITAVSFSALSLVRR